MAEGSVGRTQDKRRLVLALLLAFGAEAVLVTVEAWRHPPPAPVPAAPAPPVAGLDPGVSGPSADHASVRWMDPAGWWVTCYGVQSFPSPDRRWRLVAVNFDYLTADKSAPSGTDDFVTLLPTAAKELTPQEAWALDRSATGFHQALCSVVWTADSRHCAFVLRDPVVRSLKTLYLMASDRIGLPELRAHKVERLFLRGNVKLLDDGTVVADYYRSQADLQADIDGDRPDLRDKARVNVSLADTGS